MAQQRGRRRRGEGGVRQRTDGRWEATLARGDGTRKYHYAATEHEALRWLRDARRTLEQGAMLPDERQTVATWLETWLTTMTPTRAPGTVKRHRELVRLHIAPHIGRIKLAKLTPIQVQTFYSALLSEDGLSPSTVHRIHAVVHKALEDAMRLDLIVRNVADRVTAPRPVQREMATFSDGQVAAFLAAVRGERLEALYVLAVTAGMRLGELLGLQWGDLDLTCRWAQVQRNLQQDREPPYRLYLRMPKTASSRRRVALMPFAVETLKAHRVRQNEERLNRGAAWRGQDFVFCNEVGAPLSPQHVYDRFRRICRQAGLPAIRFHDLRHTCATLMLQAGVDPNKAKVQLGHAHISTTYDIYAHVSAGMQQDAADALAKVIAR